MYNLVVSIILCGVVLGSVVHFYQFGRKFTTKNAHTQKNEYFFVKMIDSSIKYMATKKAYIWNIRNLESGRNLTEMFKNSK